MLGVNRMLLFFLGAFDRVSVSLTFKGLASVSERFRRSEVWTHRRNVDLYNTEILGAVGAHQNTIEGLPDPIGSCTSLTLPGLREAHTSVDLSQQGICIPAVTFSFCVQITLSYLHNCA